MATILLGVSGSIAAYKAADLASKLKQAGHDVTALLTRSACQLISPHTFLNLTGNRCYTDLWDPAGQTEHIALTDRADLLVLAPATAHLIGRLAHGLADDMLTTTALAVRCPVLVVPAMNTRMWENPAVQKNVAALRELGHRLLLPGSGHLACGHTGAGRLPETPEILAAIEEALGGAPAGARQLFLEITTYDAAPGGEELEAELRFRQELSAAGELIASGRLGSPGSHRWGHLHRAESLEVAMARARRSPLAQHNCRIEVFPWKLELGLPG